MWDRVAGVIRARKGARQLAVANAGTIPDRGLYSVTLPDGRRVGELDEEMVYEARPGQAVLLGASTWRIEEITPRPRDRHARSRRARRGAVLEGRLGRAPEGARAGRGEFARWAVEQDERTLAREHDLDERAARNLLAYLREQFAACGAADDQTIVLERFRDEIGDWRLCVLSPWGGRVHAAWAIAIRPRIQERSGLEVPTFSTDDGLALRFPDADPGRSMSRSS